jgi:hypothetical protein
MTPNAWVAEITGTEPQYHFSRSFLRTDRAARSISVDLHPKKIYEVSCPERKPLHYTFAIQFRVEGSRRHMRRSGEPESLRSLDS